MRKLLLCSLVLSLCSVLVKCEDTLVFTAVAFRHGHRAPSYPQYNLNLDKWPHFGELTSVGVRQAFLLGTEFRRRYVTTKGLLPPTFDPYTVSLESTDLNRTIMTGLSFMQGLYPPGTGPTLPTNYQPERAVPPNNISSINITAYDDDSIINQVQPIPVYQKPNLACFKQYAVITSAPSDYGNQLGNLSLKFASFFSQLNTYYNVTNITIKNINDIYDVWISDYFNNNNLPNNDKTSDFWKNLTKLNDFNFHALFAGNAEINKYVATFYYNKIRGSLGAKIAGKINYKTSVFVTHDGVLASVLQSLKLSSMDCLYENIMNDTDYSTKCLGHPTYISNMIYELYNNSGSLTVKMRYNDKEYSPCNNNQTSCTWTDFNAYIDSITVPFAELDVRCGNVAAATTIDTNFDATTIPTPKNTASPQFVVLFSLLLAMLIILV